MVRSRECPAADDCERPPRRLEPAMPLRRSLRVFRLGSSAPPPPRSESLGAMRRCATGRAFGRQLISPRDKDGVEQSSRQERSARWERPWRLSARAALCRGEPRRADVIGLGRLSSDKSRVPPMPTVARSVAEAPTIASPSQVGRRSKTVIRR